MPAKQVAVRSLLLNGTCFGCVRRAVFFPRRSSRFFSSTSRRAAIAAPEIDFTKLPAADPRRARIVPSSPSYFTTSPGYTDDLIKLERIARHWSRLPTLTAAAAPRVVWKTQPQYKMLVGEEVSPSRYERVLDILRRLNRIHPAVMPQEVKDEIASHRRDIDPLAVRRKVIEVDEFGRAYGAGRRKSSRAEAWIVEGEGEVLINGKSLTEAFGRLHDRESAVWALKATNRLDKYNVFVTVHGGGTTGQAESTTLAVAKALMVHEPALKPALRRAGCVTRDPRRVERKKPGRLKARKMPTWVKR